jgi:uncharacterized protein YdiU (UPF0061 family)
MAEDRADHTITWRRLGRFGRDPDAVRDCFVQRERFDAWAARYRERLAHESDDAAAREARMNRVNPKFVLRNHLAQTAIERALQGDFGEVERLRRVLERPFDEQPEHEAGFPPAWAGEIEVSCSS